MRRIVVAFAMFFVVFPLFGSISSISPSTVYVGDIEGFVSIRGSGLVGSESTMVFFTGQNGSFGVEPSNADPSLLVVWVPIDVALNVGTYAVTVETKNIGAAPVTQGPIAFDVISRPGDGPPLLTLPENVVAEAESSAGANVFYDAFATSANGDPLDVSCDHASGSLFALGSTPVHCSASDAFGTSSGDFLVLVSDTTPPTLTVPGNIATDDPVVFYTVTATDNIDGTIVPSCTPPSGSTFPGGTTVVRCTARDSFSNQVAASFTVTVAGPPSLEVPDDIVEEATSAAGAVVQYVVVSDTGVDALCTPLSGSTFPLGTTIVRCSATNTHGTTNGSFNITVVDTTAPQLTVPDDITTFATSSLGANVNFTASATDAVDGTVAVTCAPPSGSLFPIDTTYVLCTAKDAHNNIDSAIFSVTVTPVPPPTLNLPANITAEATGPNGAVVTYTVTATGGATPVCSPASGSTFPLGTTTVQCSATNAAGTATGSFTVTVRDTTPPSIVKITANPNNLWPPSHKMEPVTISVVAIDIVDVAPVSHIIAVSSNQPPTGTGGGSTSPDWVITGPLTLQVRSERSSGADRVYTITIETRDASGNTATGTVDVTVTQTKATH